MLRTFNFHRPDAVTIGRYRCASWRLHPSVSPATPFCRVKNNSVADGDRPKRQPTKHLGLLSPKTRFTTEIDNDDNYADRTRSCLMAATFSPRAFMRPIR